MSLWIRLCNHTYIHTCKGAPHAWHCCAMRTHRNTCFGSSVATATAGARSPCTPLHTAPSSHSPCALRYARYARVLCGMRVLLQLVLAAAGSQSVASAFHQGVSQVAVSCDPVHACMRRRQRHPHDYTRLERGPLCNAYTGGLFSLCLVPCSTGGAAVHGQCRLRRE